MIHEITRSKIPRSNTNNISCHFVSLVRVVSWIDLFTKKSAQDNKKLTVCFTENTENAQIMRKHNTAEAAGIFRMYWFSLSKSAKSVDEHRRSDREISSDCGTVRFYSRSHLQCSPSSPACRLTGQSLGVLIFVAGTFRWTSCHLLSKSDESQCLSPLSRLMSENISNEKFNHPAPRQQ